MFLTNKFVFVPFSTFSVWIETLPHDQLSPTFKGTQSRNIFEKFKSTKNEVARFQIGLN